ncbi:hypothetical protein [Streptomyces orinoci]|uniref:DUF916 domain-containing protein n=1 Tax=Streptomyces orinoci TaxID=67339 RepID=A0ABV3K3J8_STRON|nr:hypothetical protein [Streptomyces orinoci]
MTPAAAALAGLLLAGAPPPWTAGPVVEGGGPGGRGAFVLEGGPGTVLQDRLSVVNPGDRVRTVTLRGTGSWVALAAGRVSVPPRTRAEVPLTVTVPVGAAEGDHTAAVVVGGDGRTVRVPVLVRVGGGGLAALGVDRVTVTGTGGGAVIRYRLANRGTTVLSPRLSIEAEGLLGRALRRRRAHGVPGRLAPGRSVWLTEQWPDAPRLEDRVRVRVTAAAPGADQVSASGTYTPLPWLRPATGAAAVLLAALAARHRHTRRRRTP